MPTVNLSSEKKKAQHSQQHLQQASEEVPQSRDNSRNDNSRPGNNNSRNDGMRCENKRKSCTKRGDHGSLDKPESKVISQSTVKNADAPIRKVNSTFVNKTVRHNEQHSFDNSRYNNSRHSNYNNRYSSGGMRRGNLRRSYEKRDDRAILDLHKQEVPSQTQVKYVDAPLPTVNPWFKNKTAHHIEQQSQHEVKEVTSAQLRDDSVDNNSPHADNNIGINN
jgi:hypothetical protein